jgi:hypothetical protein
VRFSTRRGIARTEAGLFEEARHDFALVEKFLHGDPRGHDLDDGTGIALSEIAFAAGNLKRAVALCESYLPFARITHAYGDAGLVTARGAPGHRVLQVAHP